MLIDSAAVWALLDLNTDKPIAGSLTGPADGTIPAMCRRLKGGEDCRNNRVLPFK